MKTSELTGAELDYWVAKAQGYVRLNDEVYLKPAWGYPDGSWLPDPMYTPTTNWQQCGELINDFGIALKPLQDRMDCSWYAICKYYPCYRNNGCIGLSAQEAICRSVVASVYGEEVPE